ncbi:MAG: hypothetical protein D4R79_20370 [Comamonadaceae bacterium]|nr:MAG: hypothetical protein D4R79_20370 [Comamonadaceae bacterium]
MNTAQQAQRGVAVGSMHDMTALLAGSTSCRTPQGRGVLPPTRHCLIICEALLLATSVVASFFVHGAVQAGGTVPTQKQGTSNRLR